jgi:putative ABC transport system substrate-binding protein
MNRRQLLRLVPALLALPPCVAGAQQASGVRRIGFLMGLPEAESQTAVAAFRDGLKKLGLEDGRNIAIDERWAGIDPAKATAFAKEIVALKPDLIVASTNQVVSIVMRETQTIPVVFVFIGDPLGSGYADTIQRPGRNLTGFANFEAPMGAKWLEILKEVSPTTKRVGFVYHPAVSAHLQFLDAAQGSASLFGMELTPIAVRSVADMERLIPAFAAGGPHGGIVVPPHALTLGSRSLITGLAMQHRLPGVYGDGVFARSGGLVSYGINPPDQLRRAATYVDAILKGTKPADLPVQLPVSYEMIINLSVAKQLGAEVPASVLARADHLIE